MGVSYCTTLSLHILSCQLFKRYWSVEVMIDLNLDLWADKIIKKLIDGDSEDKDTLRLMNSFNNRINQYKDVIICITGERASGKSSTAIIFAILLMKGDLNFDFSNIFYSGLDYEKAIHKIVTTQKNIFIFDEMIDMAYGRDAMAKKNRELAKIITKSRKLNHVYIYCIPDFMALDSYFRNKIVHFWIHVAGNSSFDEYSKNYRMCTLHRKDKSPLTLDPWGIDAIIKKHKKGKDVMAFSMGDTIKLMRRLKSYLTTISVPVLPKPIYDHYDEKSKEALGLGGQKLLRNVKGEKLTEADKIRHRIKKLIQQRKKAKS